MAKTKLKKPRQVVANNNNNNIDSSKSNLEELKKIENAFYFHSSPPKVLQNGSGSYRIREYIRDGDIQALEELLLAGHGPSLINQPSTDKNVRAFLKTVPAYMAKIDLVHDAAERGNLRDLKALLDRRKLARSRDNQGIGLLHKAVLNGKSEIVDYLISEYPESTNVTDVEGRTPFHYCAASRRPEKMFNFMSEKLIETQYRDDKGNTASYYMQRPSELSIARRDSLKNGLTPYRKKKSPPSKKSSPSHKMRTPPKREGLNITGANIRIWIHDQDLAKLEQIVWEGQGHRLLNETSNIPKVRTFLQLVPRMMTKIKEVHQAAISGDLETMEAKTDQTEMLLAKDHNGLNPLHRAAALGHADICEWIVTRNPAAIQGMDRKGRTPLHYSTNPTDGGQIYNLFIKCGADPNQVDHFNRTADYYRGRPGDIDISVVYDAPSAPRIGGLILSDNPSSKYPSRANSGGRQRFGGRWVTSPARSDRSYNYSRSSKTSTNGSETVKKSNKETPIKSSNFYNNLYNKGRKDFTGKRKYIDLKDVTEKEIDKMIQDGDVEKLEYVVLSGRGGALRGKTSWNDNVRIFLKKLPLYMEKVSTLHQYAAEGNLEMVKRLTREYGKYAMGRDKDGAIALHYAARSGNLQTTKHLLDIFPDGMFVEDRNIRVPIHWAALSREPGVDKVYKLLEKKGSYVHACDVNGKSADDYIKENGLTVDSNELSRRPSMTSQRAESISPAVSVSNSPSRKTRSRNKSLSPVPSNQSLGTNESRAPSRSKSKSPSKSNSLSPAISPAKNKSKSPTKNKSKSPAISKAKSPAISKSKSPAINKSKSPAISKSKSPAISKSNSPVINKSKSPAINKSKSPARNKSKSPAINKSKSPAKTETESSAETETKEVSKNKTKSKTTKPKNEEVDQAILDAENEDYNGLSRIILRGDGHLLVGGKSANEEVQSFLDDLPESLRKISDIQKAVEEGDLRKTMNLLDRREKAYVKDANQSNLLHTATIYGHSDLARYMIQTFPDLINQQDMKGRTPLHYAASLRDGGHLLKVLKMSNGDPYIKDTNGNTAEDYANNTELLPEKVLKAELEEGKEKKAKEATENLNKEYGGDLEENGENEEEDENEENEGDEDMADVEEEGETANSAGTDKTAIVKEATASPKSEKNGDTEDASNAAEGADESVDPELEVEAAIRAAEQKEYEPLSDIVRRGDGRLLIGKTSTDEDVQDYLEKIPDILLSIDELFKAAENGETRKVGDLLDRKDKAKIKTKQQANLLHVAVINGHSDTVRYLVQGFPSVLSDTDVNGRTPLHYAAVVRDGGHLYKILKRANADSTVKDKTGYTPEDYLNDTGLLTQWDLLKELKDEGDLEYDEKGRPITKDSVTTYYGSEEEGMQSVDKENLQKIEEAYSKLKNSNSDSLLKKYLTQDVFDSLKHRMTNNGATLLDVVNSGIENPDSSIGVYAPDAESYVMFKELFDPIINEYHHVDFDPEDEHLSTDFGDADLLGDLNEEGDYVISTRIRCARSLEGYPFNSKMTLEQYIEVEQDVEAALDILDGELAGYYTSLSDLSAEDSQDLVNKHLLFKQDDKYLEAAGACRFWPKGRGIYLNSDNTLVVWVNEEDHLRIISMQEGGDLKAAYERFVKTVLILEDRLPFSHSQRLGYLTFCPTNLGTAIRASVHIRLPHLGKDRELLDGIADRFHLQVRGTRGEHSDAEGSVFDISNKRRLGLTEIDAIQDMQEGVEELIRLEIKEALGSGN